MVSHSAAVEHAAPADRILPITKVVSALIIPFLVLAFLFLYFTPDESGTRFAWEIRPRIQAMFVGAGYIGGCYIFVRALVGKHWHHVAAGFWPITTFTISMLLLTILHWDRFNLSHFPFQVWLILYIITPILVPWIWLHNRSEDPGILQPTELLVPKFVRLAMGVVGALLLAFALIGFVFPAWLIGLWPWMLAPLSARALSGWFSLLGIGGLVIAREPRWSGWKSGMESIAIWHVLVLLAAVLNPGDFVGGTLFNGYIVSVVVVLVGMLVLYGVMEHRRRLKLHGSVAK